MNIATFHLWPLILHEDCALKAGPSPKRIGAVITRKEDVRSSTAKGLRPCGMRRRGIGILVEQFLGLFGRSVCVCVYSVHFGGEP